MTQNDPHAHLRAALADGAIMLAHEIASGRPGHYHVVNAEGRDPRFSCPADEYLAVVPWSPAFAALKPVLAELDRAIAKFPTWPTDPLHAVAVIAEELGELTQAVLQAVYEPHKSTPDHVRLEALQVAATAIRFAGSLDRYVYARGEQHEQAANG